MFPWELQWVRPQPPSAELCASHASLIWKIVKTLHSAKFFCSPKDVGAVQSTFPVTFHLASQLLSALVNSLPSLARVKDSQGSARFLSARELPAAWRLRKDQTVLIPGKETRGSEEIAGIPLRFSKLPLPPRITSPVFLHLTDFQTTECLHVFHFKVPET